jgi:hypothetical protein
VCEFGIVEVGGKRASVLRALISGSSQPPSRRGEGGVCIGAGYLLAAGAVHGRPALAASSNGRWSTRRIGHSVRSAATIWKKVNDWTASALSTPEKRGAFEQLKGFVRGVIDAPEIEAHAFRLVGESQEAIDREARELFELLMQQWPPEPLCANGWLKELHNVKQLSTINHSLAPIGRSGSSLISPPPRASRAAAAP